MEGVPSNESTPLLLKIEVVPSETNTEKAMGSSQHQQTLSLSQGEEIEEEEARKTEDTPKEPHIVSAVVNSIKKDVAEIPVKPGDKDDSSFGFGDKRLGSDSVYEPTVLSIGPYHWKKLKKMDYEKKLFVHDVLTRFRPDLDKSLQECVEEIMRQESGARKCYMNATEVPSLEPHEFVEMLVVDGCFMIELLFKCTYHDPLPESLYQSTVWTDLLKLGNQIPFSVLEALFKKVLQSTPSSPRAMKPRGEGLPFSFLAVYSLRENITECRFIRLGKCWSTRKAVHLLDLYYLCLTPESDEEGKPDTRSSKYRIQWSTHPSLFLGILADIIMVMIFGPHRLLKYIFMKPSPDGEREKRPSDDPEMDAIDYALNVLRGLSNMSLALKGKEQPSALQANIPCATQLEDWGVEFTKREEWSSLCDITFDIFRGIMQIPQLSIDRGTLTRLANLIAYDKHRKGKKKYILSFVLLMDQLINSHKDVALLQEREIIKSDLGAGELARFFNGISRGFNLTTSDAYRICELSKDVEEYRRCKLHRWRAYLKMLKRDYFSNPWALISFLAAVIALGLTLAQTVFTIYPYYHPRS